MHRPRAPPAAGRLKQWLNLLRRRFAEAELAYQHVRTMNDQRAISVWVAALQADAEADVMRSQ